ncbi:hypothetical protein ACQP1W_22440 [Spirillospora sp. CA-255316]
MPDLRLTLNRESRFSERERRDEPPGTGAAARGRGLELTVVAHNQADGATVDEYSMGLPLERPSDPR